MRFLSPRHLRGRLNARFQRIKDGGVILFIMGFEVLDISGDVGIRACGKSCGEMFVNAGLGMYSLISDIGKVGEKQDVVLEAEGDSLESLLVNFLNEMIFQFDTYGFIGKRILMDTFSPQGAAFLRARVYGEEFDPERHERRLLIKAATYHNIKVEQVSDTWEADVIFDI